MAELWAYIKDICRHWVWWTSSTLIAAVLAIYQGGGRVISAWLIWTWAIAGIFVATFLAWRGQYRKVQEFTKKAPVEIIDDLIHEGKELENWLTGLVTEYRQKVDDWTEKVRIQLRARAPDYVALFNEAIKHPTPDLLPKSTGRSIIEIGEWRSDEQRHLAWQQVASAVAQLKKIRMTLYSRVGF
jgi:hypothetical protein